MANELQSGVDLGNPQVRGMLHDAWLVVIQARAERLAREAKERHEKGERPTLQEVSTQ